MKKVFISQPMRGVPLEEVLATRKEAVEFLKQQHYEVINPDLLTPEEEVEKNPPLASLGRSLVQMAEADALCAIGDWEKARGCRIEAYAAQEYGLERFQLG